MLNKYERAVKTFQKNGASFEPDPLPKVQLAESSVNSVAALREMYNNFVNSLAAAGIVEIKESIH